MLFFKKISLSLSILLCAGIAYNSYAAGDTESPAKGYAIRSAQMAKQAYQYSGFAYFLKDGKSISLNVKSAISLIETSMNAMDSAIYFATKDSSDLVGLDYAYISKQYNKEAKAVLKKSLLVEDGETRRLYFKKAIFLCGNATVEAYTASLYMDGNASDGGNSSPSATPPSTPPANGKPLTKLEVDKALFSVLDDDLKRQEDKIVKDIEDLQQKLATTTDPAEKTRIKNQIKEFEAKLAEIRAKRQETQKKYADIVELIRQEKEKNGDVSANAGTGSVEPTYELKTKPAAPANATFETSNDAWGESVIMDQVMPKGLFYKVQIGVYKTKIDPNIFQGITPITGETTPNGVRYAAGMFTKIADAKEAKDYIKGLGYNDAFVAAYFDGKKISIADASKLEK